MAPSLSMGAWVQCYGLDVPQLARAYMLSHLVSMYVIVLGRLQNFKGVKFFQQEEAIVKGADIEVRTWPFFSFSTSLFLILLDVSKDATATNCSCGHAFPPRTLS